MYSDHRNPPFKQRSFYIVLDVLFLVFSILYLIGDSDHLNNFLKYTKPIPLWLLMAQLWSLRHVHLGIHLIFWGLAFGSLGDILLLFGIFEAGAGAFLVGHVLDVYAFVIMAKDIAENRASIREVLGRQPLFIALWIVLMTFSFWSISFITRFVSQTSPMPYILALYGAVLVMLVMGGLFFYFTTAAVSRDIHTAGLLFMIGSLVFLASDNFLAHGKFNKVYPINPFWNSFLIMITYYSAQWLIAKGAFMTSVWLTED